MLDTHRSNIRQLDGRRSKEHQWGNQGDHHILHLTTSTSISQVLTFESEDYPWFSQSGETNEPVADTSEEALIEVDPDRPNGEKYDAFK